MTAIERLELASLCATLADAFARAADIWDRYRPNLAIPDPDRETLAEAYRRLERAAVILLNRVMDQDGDGNPIPSELVDFDIRKNRFGPNDVSVRTLADLSRQRFEELD